MRKIISLIIVLILTYSNSFSQSYVQVGNGVVSSTYPVYGSWSYGWYSVIYTQTELEGAKLITKIAIDCINGPKTANNQKIYLKQSSITTFSAANYEDPTNNGYTLVFDGNINFVSGYNIIDITDFNYDGTSNLIMHWENRNGDFNYQYPNFNSTTSAINDNKGYGTDGSFPTGSGYLNPYPNSRPNIRFYYLSSGPNPAENPFPVENSVKALVDTDLEFNLDATAQTYDIYFGTSSTNLIKVVDNATAINGLNTVSIANYNAGNLLNSKTDYFWNVVAKSGSDESPSAVYKFTTQVFITDYPYNQGFEEGNPNEVVFHPGFYGIDVDWDYIAEWNYSDAEYAPHNGLKSAYISPSFMETNEEYSLTTPRFDLSNTNYQISFYWKNYDPFKNNKILNADITYFEISTDNGQTWTELASLYPETSMTGYVQAIINLSDYDSDNVRFRWRYKVLNSANYPAMVFLDDIEIKEITAGTMINLSQTNYTFPQLFLNGKTSFQVDIQNSHAVNNLVITGCNITGPYFCDFTGTITPGQIQTATIIYQPTEAGNNQTGTVEFLIDGDFSGNNEISLSGNCLENLSSIYEYFETTNLNEIPTNWNKITDETNINHFVKVVTGLTGEYNTGEKVLRIYNASDLENPLIAITPGVTNFDENTLSFYAVTSNESDEIILQIGLMDDPYNAGSFTLVEEIIVPVNTTQQFIINSIPANNTKPYIAFKHKSEYSASIRIDDVEWKNNNVVTPPNPAAIVSPANASVNFDIYASTLQLNWSNGGGAPTNYKLYFGTNNPPTNIENGTNLNLALIYNITENLAFNQTYYWKIVPINEYGEAENCPVWSFTTMQDPTISTYPYSQNYDGITAGTGIQYPLGWAVENANEDNISWDVVSNYATPDLAHSAPNAMHLVFSYYEMNDWLFTPPCVLNTANEYTVSFWYKTMGDEILPNPVEKLSIYSGSDNSSAAMSATPLYQNLNLNNLTWQQASFNFVPETNGSYFFGFNGHSDEYQGLLLLDDVTITENTSNINLVSSEISIYPNPTSGIIKFDVNKNCTVDFFDISGKLIFTKNISPSNNCIDLSNLITNLYLVRITEGNNVYFTKILKQ